MEPSRVRKDLKIKTNAALGSTQGMCVHHLNLAARRTEAEGIVLGPVPGLGGDVWWVAHEDSQVAAYAYTEFSPA